MVTALRLKYRSLNPHFLSPSFADLGNGDLNGTGQSSFKAKMQSSNVSLKKPVVQHAACCQNGQNKPPVAGAAMTSSSSSSSSASMVMAAKIGNGGESSHSQLNLEEEDQVSAV